MPAGLLPGQAGGLGVPAVPVRDVHLYYRQRQQRGPLHARVGGQRPGPVHQPPRLWRALGVPAGDVHGVGGVPAVPPGLLLPLHAGLLLGPDGRARLPRRHHVGQGRGHQPERLLHAQHSPALHF